MKIRTKLTVLLIFMSLLLTCSLGSVFYFHTKKVIEDDIVSRLNTIADENSQEIVNFLDREKTIVNIAADQQELTNDELEQMVEIDRNIDEMFVLDSSGIIVASSDPARIGLDRSTDDYFMNRSERTHIKNVYISPKNNKTSIAISTQFHRGVLVGRISTDAIDALLADNLGDESTEEVLLARRDENGDTLFFTKRQGGGDSDRFLKLPKERLEVPMTRALLKNEAVFDDGVDYRGRQVIAVTRYINETDWGLVSKRDKADVLSPLEKVRDYTLLISLVAFITAFTVAFTVSRSITTPLKGLTEFAIEIKEGKAQVDSADFNGNLDYEIALLGNTMKEMKEGIDDRNALLDSILNAFEGRFGSIAAILVRQNVQELAEKNPRITKILPKKLRSSINKARAMENNGKTGRR